MEGGVTNGEQIVLRASMKPISTLMRPLVTIEMKTREPAQAVAERSDVTAVPAMGVIAEAMTAFIVARLSSRSSAEILSRRLGAITTITFSP